MFTVKWWPILLLRDIFLGTCELKANDVTTDLFTFINSVFPSDLAPYAVHKPPSQITRQEWTENMFLLGSRYSNSIWNDFGRLLFGYLHDFMDGDQHFCDL